MDGQSWCHIPGFLPPLKQVDTEKERKARMTVNHLFAYEEVTIFLSVHVKVVKEREGSEHLNNQPLEFGLRWAFEVLMNRSL